MTSSKRNTQRFAIGLISTLLFVACASKTNNVAQDDASPTSTLSPRYNDATSQGDPSSRSGATAWTKFPAGSSWQWQLSAKLDLSVDVDVYDIDGADNSADVIDQLHRSGRKVICYVSAGSWEPFREDNASIPESIRGNSLDGWPDERWLDIRQLDVLRPIMAARFDQCATKKFDAVEPDNVDGYDNKTGFDLTAADQVAYLKMLTTMAHERGLAIGQKNVVDLTDQLAPTMDFAVNESCFEFDECDVLKAYIAQDKAVFHAEYDVDVSKFCTKTKALGFSSIRKNIDLDSYVERC